MSSPARHPVKGMVESMSLGGEEALQAASALLPVLYSELRELARVRLAAEGPGQTLHATALVHEAYLRLVGEADPGWSGRAHFFGAAARAMRQVLVDRARGRARVKRGGGAQRVTLDSGAAIGEEPNLEILELDEALERLKAHDERKAEVVMLRYFAGLEIDETAQALRISPATVKSDWAYARAWLYRELYGRSDVAGEP